MRNILILQNVIPIYKPGPGAAVITSLSENGPGKNGLDRNGRGKKLLYTIYY